MKTIHWVLLAELAALALLIRQGRSEVRPARPLPAGARALMDPRTQRRTTRPGPTGQGTLGGLEYSEGGGIYR